MSRAAANPELWTEEDEIHATLKLDTFTRFNYKRGCTLGVGGSSAVYKVLHRITGQVYAAKTSQAIVELQKEKYMLQQISHARILKMRDWCQVLAKPEKTLLVTELCVVGTLQARIDRIGLSTEQTLHCIVQLADALRYLHGKDLFHSDVKPRNVFLRSINPVDLVLGDLGDIKQNGAQPSARGTKEYWSKEILDTGCHYGPSDDIWAFGVSILGMVGQWPKLRHTSHELRDYPFKCHRHVRQLQHLNGTNDIVTLLGKTVAWEARHRISAEECWQMGMELIRNFKDEDQWTIQAPAGFEALSFW